MMLNIKKFILSSFVLLCTAAMILPCAAVAVGAGASEVAEQAYDPDYSNPASEAIVTLTPSEFTELLTQETLSDAEKDYIDSMLIGSPFKYNNVVPPKCVQTIYDNNTLEITAEVYSYTAKNGATVRWLPRRFLLVGTELSGDMTLNSESGAYTATVNDLTENTVTAIELEYTCAISVKGEEADTYINYTYSHAKAFDEQQKSYETQLAAYEKYQAYIVEKSAYDKAFAEYTEYLAKKATYDKKYAEYTKYLADMKTYNENLAAYNAYKAAKVEYDSKLAAYEKAHAEYVTKLNAYNAEKQKYDEYMAKLNIVLERMANIESVFAANSEGKRLYSTLMGDTVATVVDNKPALVSQGGCDPNLIDQAGDSTNALQSLLTEYNSKKTIAEKLAYYQAHYDEIKTNFALLYGALYALVSKDLSGNSAERVVMVLKQNGKYERYIEFVIQLYAVATGLDDAQARDNNKALFKTYDVEHDLVVNHTVLSDLEEAHRPKDGNNANPAGLTCPTEVKEPSEAPTFGMTKPTAPTEVKEPLLPALVNEPTAPAVVAEPTKPVEVPETEKPIAPSFSAEEKVIMAEYASGALKKREANDKVLNFSTKLTKPVSLLNKRHVEFYDYNGQKLLYSQELELGDEIVYPHEDPTRRETQSHTYTFAGWRDEEGELVTDLGVADDIYHVFYASYTSKIKQYTVTWVIGEESTTQAFDYGTIPSFGSTPTKAETAQYTYTFSGWRQGNGSASNNTLPPIVRNMTYEAVFEPILRYYNVTWIWGKNGESTAVDSVAYGSMPVCDRNTARPEDDKYIYTFKSWDKELSEVTGDVTYTAVYDAKPIITASGDDKEIGIVTDGEIYKVNVPDAGLKVDSLLGLATLRDKNIELTSSDNSAKLLLNEAMITNLAAAGCTDVAMRPDGEGNNTLLVVFSDANGESLELVAPVTVRFFDATEYTKAYSLSSDGTLTPLLSSIDGKVISVQLSKSETVVFRDEYSVEVAPLENGMLSADIIMAYEGQTIKLSASFSEQYELSYFKVIGKISGNEYAVAEDGSFAMPAEPVTVSGALALREFTVKFVVDGVVISEKIYHLGDKVEVPADPTKADNGEIVYTFSGWTPTVTAVNADVTYTAVFSETVNNGTDVYLPPEVNDRSYILYLEIAAVVLVIAAAIAIPIVLKKRKKRKMKAEQDSSTEK